MDRNEDEGLRRELGLTRRELLRRGAIVGGTLLWATPVIQTIRPQGAFAASPVQTCCACYDSASGKVTCGTGYPSRGACSSWCSSQGMQMKQFKAGPNGYACSGRGCRSV